MGGPAVAGASFGAYCVAHGTERRGPHCGVVVLVVRVAAACASPCAGDESDGEPVPRPAAAGELAAGATAAASGANVAWRHGVGKAPGAAPCPNGRARVFATLAGARIVARAQDAEGPRRAAMHPPVRGGRCHGRDGRPLRHVRAQVISVAAGNGGRGAAGFCDHRLRCGGARRAGRGAPGEAVRVRAAPAATFGDARGPVRLRAPASRDAPGRAAPDSPRPVATSPFRRHTRRRPPRRSMSPARRTRGPQAKSPRLRAVPDPERNRVGRRGLANRDTIFKARSEETCAW